MAFRLFLVCSFVLLARPQDILTFLQPFRPALVITVLATTALLFSGRGKDFSTALSTPEWKRYFAFFLIMVIGIPFSYYKSIAFDGVLQRYVVNMLFFLLLVSHINSLEKLKSLTWVICLSTLTYGVLGALLQTGGPVSGRIQAVGGVLDPNDTAYVLLAMFPLCLFFVQFESGTVKKLVALLAICGAIATVLLTGSRGGLVALGTVLLLLLLTKFGGLSKTPKFLIATVVVLSVAWLLAADKIDAQRYLTMSNISSDYNVTESGGRIALWGEAIDLILDNPITGVGVDCYATANHQARLLRGATYFRWHAVHNSYLQVAAEVGLVGFALFLIICVRTIATFLAAATHKMRSHADRPSEFRALAGLMLLGFVGNLVAGFFLSQGYSIFFTLFFALAAAVAQIHRRASEPLVIPSGAPTPAAVPR